MEQVECRRIKFAELSESFRAIFMPRPGEDHAQHVSRILQREDEIYAAATSMVRRLMKAMRAGERIPPVVMSRNSGGTYAIEDGWLRTAAAAALGRDSIAAVSYPESLGGGSVVGAVLYALSTCDPRSYAHGGHVPAEEA